MSDARMAPQYCPYCGDTDLRPYESDGTWVCRSCVRGFSVKFRGLVARKSVETSDIAFNEDGGDDT